jgi:hypothetical protein
MYQLIINQDVLLKDDETVQTKLSMFLIKKTSPTSSQEHA